MTLTRATFALLLSVLGGADEEAREVEISRLAAEGSDAIPVLKEVLENGRWRARQAAIETLGRVGGPAIPALMSTARHHPQVDGRRLSIRVLGRLLDKEGCDSLLSLGRMAERGVVATALGTPPCGPSVIEPFLSDPDPDVRRRAIESYTMALAVNPESGNLEPIVGLLSDSHRMVKEAAVVSLVKSNPDTLMSVMPTVRGSRVVLIRALEGSWPDRFIEPLIVLMKSGSWPEQAAIVDVLGSREVGRAALVNLDTKRLHPYVRSRVDYMLEAERGD